MTIHKPSHLWYTVLLIIIIVMALSALQVPMSSIMQLSVQQVLLSVLLLKTVFKRRRRFIYFFKAFKCGDYVKIGDSEELLTPFYTLHHPKDFSKIR